MYIYIYIYIYMTKIFSLIYNFEKATNLGKLYFIPKIHKNLNAVPGWTAISKYGMPAKEFPEYWDHILKLAMQNSWSYIKGFVEFQRIFEESEKNTQNYR